MCFNRSGAEMNVTVLGATGMLGSMVLEIFSRIPGVRLTGVCRTVPLGLASSGVRWCKLDVSTAGREEIKSCIDGSQWVINCIGLIKIHINDFESESVQNALKINAVFPHLLCDASLDVGCRVLQIATDCVFSGDRGEYVEMDPHDPLDVYGKTKSLGEVRASGFHNLRCSIIGPEQKERKSLLEWFLGQGRGARVNGYLNHYWNGVTTLHFARMCQGIVLGGVDLPEVAHVVPADVVSKGCLLQKVALEYGRTDIDINLIQMPEAVDRTLGTVDPVLNQKIWMAAGYPAPPSIGTMVEELARFSKTISERSQ